MKFLKEKPMIKSNHTIIHNHTRDIIMMIMKLSTEKKKLKYLLPPILLWNYNQNYNIKKGTGNNLQQVAIDSEATILKL